jgi:hypothetical protein
MSVLPSDIVAYGSANMPEANGVTVGSGRPARPRHHDLDRRSY